MAENKTKKSTTLKQISTMRTVVDFKPMQSSLQIFFFFMTCTFPGHRNDVKMHKLEWNHKLQARRFNAHFLKILFVVWAIFKLTLFNPFLAKFLRTFTL